MAQHDYNIANGSGLTVRTDLNLALSAILTNNSGATAPTTTQPLMWWYDTTTSLLKMRNAGNTAWNTIVPITASLASKLATARTINGVSFDGSANINIEDRKGTNIASAATTTIGTAGLGDYIHITGTTTITSFGTASAAGVRRTLIFDGALTLTHHATNLICMGATNIVTVANTIIEVVAETTNTWRVVSITHPTLSMAELSYLDGVTSAIQTQLNAKQATLVSGTNIKTVNGTTLLGTGNIEILSNITGVFANSQEITSSGTFTVPAGVTKIMFQVAHAGGGGGGGGSLNSSTSGSGGGGGASSYTSTYVLDVTPAQDISVVIGAGGSGGAGGGGAAGSAGGIGGTTSFGTYNFFGAHGGGGGSSGANGGSGGAAVGGVAGVTGTGVGRPATGGVGALITNSTGGGNTTGSAGGLGGTSNANNGSNGVAGINGWGGAGGAGGAGKVVVYL